MHSAASVIMTTDPQPADAEPVELEILIAADEYAHGLRLGDLESISICSEG